MLAALLFLTAAVCSNGEKSVRGYVLDVQGSSLTDVASLTIQDGSGKVWHFQGAGNIGFTPSHITQHEMLGQQMTVYYKGTDDHLLAVRVTD